MKNVNNRSVSFSDFIRRRRLQLRLKQADIAAELHVTDEAIGHWESGRRRTELNKIPRLAAVLKVNPQALCRKALDEWYPAFYDGLFTDWPQLVRYLEPTSDDRQSSRKLLAPGTPDSSTLESGVVVGDGLGEREQLAE
jgi:transcriptional regulator with XRE-family HTH domain